MLSKRLVCPARVRRVPKQFSWVDQRLVRDHYVERCDAYALALLPSFWSAWLTIRG